MSVPRFAAAVALALATDAFAASQMYKCVENGRTVYQQQACNPQADPAASAARGAATTARPAASAAAASAASAATPLRRSSPASSATATRR
jgi:hypothetical protein